MRGKTHIRCNTCGWECGNGRYCEMTPNVILEQRVYDWLQKHRVSGPNVYPRDIVSSIRIRMGTGKPVPKYVVEYIREVEKRYVTS